MERNNLTKKGVVVAVILLFIGLAFAPSINANIGKSSEGISQENDTFPLEVDTLEEISTIIEENDDLRAYIEMQSDGDCGCFDDSSELEWNYQFICLLLYPLFYTVFLIWMATGWLDTFFHYILEIGYELNCFWA